MALTKRSTPHRTPTPVASTPPKPPTAALTPYEEDIDRTIRPARYGNGDYVYRDNSVLVYKTPADCTKWPISFRLRIIRDYIGVAYTLYPNLFDPAAFYQVHPQDKDYKVAGTTLRVYTPIYTDIPDSADSHLLHFAGTFVHDVAHRKVLHLYDMEPAARILCIYAFLSSDSIAGLPNLPVYGINEYLTRYGEPQ